MTHAKAAERALFLGIDVGTGSARAGIFDASGARWGLGVCPIRTERPRDDFVEQSSDDIWRACASAVRSALAMADIGPAETGCIAGIGFDATCSLVALGAYDEPVTLSPSGRDNQNIIVWMDHRAIEEASSINATGHHVLQYVGGTISPEMQTPKLLWLKRHMPESYAKTVRFFDLPDFLTYRATSIDTRSLCSTVCKWTYLGHEGEGGRWDAGFFRQVGLGDLADQGFRRIGQVVRPMGETIGGLTERAANELGLRRGTPVGVSIIDAHAGGLSLLGVRIAGEASDEAALEQRLALIGGTSSCHMAVSMAPRFIAGVWGPYRSAMIPGMWLNEGGQSATGALIDLTIHGHPRAKELLALAEREQKTIYALLNERLDALATAGGARFAGELTRDLHVLPDHHGNRSPRADPTLRGMVSGLKLSDSFDSLALLYLATVQAIAHGTRHIVDALNARGYAIGTIVACGGDTKNPVFLREHADATGCRIVLPKEPEAVLLGSAMLGAVASGLSPSVLSAMTAMSQAATVIEPSGGLVDRFHQAKHRVFLRMHDDQMAYRDIMSESLSCSIAP